MFFLVWGHKSRTVVISRASNYCPACGRNETMELLEIRKWFTLYWIPIFPYGERRRICRCKACGTTYAAVLMQLGPVSSECDMLAAE